MIKEKLRKLGVGALVGLASGGCNADIFRLFESCPLQTDIGWSLSQPYPLANGINLKVSEDGRVEYLETFKLAGITYSQLYHLFPERYGSNEEGGHNLVVRNYFGMPVFSNEINIGEDFNMHVFPDHPNARTLEITDRNCNRLLEVDVSHLEYLFF